MKKINNRLQSLGVTAIASKLNKSIRDQDWRIQNQVQQILSESLQQFSKKSNSDKDTHVYKRVKIIGIGSREVRITTSD